MSFVTIIVVLGAAGIFFVVLRWLTAPSAGTEKLVMTVWATFGPYTSAEHAEENLRLAAKMVFGEQKVDTHEKWIQGHAENFRAWEAAGEHESMQKLMRDRMRTNMHGRAYMEAYTAMRQSFIQKVKEGAAWLNKDFLEQTGHRLEPMEQADGSVQLRSKKIWSDEDIERKKSEDNDLILNAIGKNLFNDESIEARRLLAFLTNVYRANVDKEMETARDIGIAWFACLQVVQEEPNSELARTFKELSDAWSATQQDQKQT